MDDAGQSLEILPLSSTRSFWMGQCPQSDKLPVLVLPKYADTTEDGTYVFESDTIGFVQHLRSEGVDAGICVGDDLFAEESLHSEDDLMSLVLAFITDWHSVVTATKAALAYARARIAALGGNAEKATVTLDVQIEDSKYKKRIRYKGSVAPVTERVLLKALEEKD